MDSSRGADKDRGKFRVGQVYIGMPGAPIENASYVPPAPGDLPKLLENWEHYVNTNQEKDSLAQIAVAHYQLEAIHPFRDGQRPRGALADSAVFIPARFAVGRRFCTSVNILKRTAAIITAICAA